MAKRRKKRVNYVRLALVAIILILIIVLLIALVVLGFKKAKTSDDSKPSKEDKIVEKTEEESLSEEIQARVDAYMANNPDLSEEECVKRIYMNLDIEPYSQTDIVEDLDSLTMLVNKYHGLPSDYEPSDLTEITSSGENGYVAVRKTVADAFEELVVGASEIGLGVSACSAYRSYDYQAGLYNNGVANYGVEYADAYWTRPGFSEHQTGLSIDVRLDGDTSDLDAARYSANYDWFLEHLHDYGFILRYPDDKEVYTQISPESWHIRYVGKEMATYIYENNLCLDEYYGLKAEGKID